MTQILLGAIECLNWLDSKQQPKPVVNLSFGSVANLNDMQLIEIVGGLEASGKNFIWVVKKEKKEKKEEEVREEWLQEGFEEKRKGKGVIITESGITWASSNRRIRDA